MRIDKRDEQTKRFAELGRAIFQKIDETFAKPWCLTASAGRNALDITAVIVGIGTTQRGKAVIYSELGWHHRQKRVAVAWRSQR